MTVVIGLLAGALTSGAWLPQIWRTWRTRSAHDLSWAYLATTGLGMGTWLTYGVLAEDPAVIVANVCTLTFLGLLTGLKARHPRRDRAPEPVLEPAA